MKATPSNISKFQGQKVWALIFVSGTKNIKYLNIVSDLGINNSCSGGYGNGINIGYGQMGNMSVNVFVNEWL